MSGIDETYLVAVCGVVCRVGAWVAVMPGVSSARVPMRIRLFLALALAMSMTDDVIATGQPWGGGSMALVPVEVAIGLGLGLASRIYLAALEFSAVAISNLIGLSALNVGIERDELMPGFATLITVAASLLFFELGLYRALIGGLVQSYSMMPMGDLTSIGRLTPSLALWAADAFALALQLAGPFIIYGLLINIGFGFLGKLVPQIQTFFGSIPVVVIGGLLLASYTVPHSIALFAEVVMERITR